MVRLLHRGARNPAIAAATADASATGGGRSPPTGASILRPAELPLWPEAARPPAFAFARTAQSPLAAATAAATAAAAAAAAAAAYADAYAAERKWQADEIRKIVPCPFL